MSAVELSSGSWSGLSGKPSSRAQVVYASASVKVAYIFSTSGHTASYKLGKMILPQLEQGSHGVEVVGMFFFDDNTYLLREGDPIGERLGRVAAEQRHAADAVRPVRAGAVSGRG